MFNFINNRYGSKIGFFRHVNYQILFMLGMYKGYEKIDFTCVRRFIFVCSGNICRSALAEAVIKKCGGNVCSFGLDTRGGDPADQRMVVFGKDRGFDLTEHITCNVTQININSEDLLLGMEPAQCKMLRMLYPKNQITCLGIWLPRKKVYIHDPYSANNQYFRLCAREIIQASLQVYTKWMQSSKANN